MYKDIISYELAENVTEAHLLDIADQIVNDWMKKQDGFQKWEITKSDKGYYTDIVSWDNIESAKKAELAMIHIPNAGEWFSCYKEGTISTKKLSTIGYF